MNGFFEGIQSTMLLMFLSCLIFLWLVRDLCLKLRKNRLLGLPLISIVLFGLLLRAVWVMSTQPVPLSDFNVYFESAKAIYGGNYQYDVIIRHPGPAMLFVFAFYLFGPNLQAIWLLNGFLSIVMILAVFDLVLRLSGKKLALIAALVTVVLPTLIAYTAIAGSEIPSVAFLLVFIWGFFEFWERRGMEKTGLKTIVWQGSLLGLLLAGTVLIRSSSLLVIGIIPILLLFDHTFWKQKIQGFLAICLTLSLGLFSWIYHQHLVVGSGWKPFYGAELGFACAVQPGNKNGAYITPAKWSFQPPLQLPEDTTVQSDVKFYERAGQRSWAIIKERPLEYLANGYYRMQRVLKNSQTGISWAKKGSSRMKAWPPKLIQLLSTLSNVLWQILLFSSPLSLLAFAQRQTPLSTKKGLAFYGLFFFFWIGFHWVMALSNERYGFQAAPIIIILGVLGIANLYGSVQTLLSQGKMVIKMNRT